MAPKQPHVLIVGGAYAGLSTLNSLISLSSGISLPTGGPPGTAPPKPAEPLRALETRPRYTLLDERDGFYHTVGAPLGQITPSYAREFWIKYDDIVADTYANEDVEFVHGAATKLDSKNNTLEYSTVNSKKEKIAYDFLVVATGMRRTSPIVPTELDKESFLLQVERVSAELKASKKVVIVGGGAVGIEVAAKVQLEYPNNEVILIHSRDTLINAEPLPEEYKAKALELLLITGVQVKLNHRVLAEEKVQTEEGPRVQLTITGGEKLVCNKVIYSAVQKGANTDFIPAVDRDANGCILVRDTLQFPTSIPNSETIFAAGDAVAWSGVKRSGGAQNMGRICASNIITMLHATEEGKQSVELEKCPPFAPTMSLAIGEQAMGLRGGQMRYGVDVMQRAFGRGLGIEGTLKKLKIRSVNQDIRNGEKLQHDGLGHIPEAIAAHI